MKNKLSCGMPVVDELLRLRCRMLKVYIYISNGTLCLGLFTYIIVILLLLAFGKDIALIITAVSFQAFTVYYCVRNTLFSLRLAEYDRAVNAVYCCGPVTSDISKDPTTDEKLKTIAAYYSAIITRTSSPCETTLN